MHNRWHITRRALGIGVLAGAALAAAPALAEEEARTGLVQSVTDQGRYVVIDGQRYETRGRLVEPPPDVSGESQQYDTRPFQEGMVVRFTYHSGEPPAIKRAWVAE